jgi:geranylgeranyl diphosphate synthase type 3
MRERTGSFRYTRRVLQQLQEQVQTEISKLGGNELLVKIVKALQVPLEEGDEVSA